MFKKQVSLKNAHRKPKRKKKNAQRCCSLSPEAIGADYLMKDLLIPKSLNPVSNENSSKHILFTTCKTH